MEENPLERVTTLTFDLFGTVLDLAGSLAPAVDTLLAAGSASIGGGSFWDQWRARQRIEQYQDTLLTSGHSGYLETCRRALVYCLRQNKIEFSESGVEEMMAAWRELLPFPDAVQGLKRLRGRYRLVALSNGEQWLIEHLASQQIKFQFDAVISADHAGAFKPHPSVYRTAARMLSAEPSQLMMVASHSFDIMGARACGYRGAYVNRYRLPFEETPYRQDIEVYDLVELAATLV